MSDCTCPRIWSAVIPPPLCLAHSPTGTILDGMVNIAEYPIDLVDFFLSLLQEIRGTDE